ncbi:MAG: DNA cytosine methyltransferase [Dehalococcoidia bacterium]|nr:DNA cytosine methyltransferase [Dehalococcoidia bacterium]
MAYRLLDLYSGAGGCARGYQLAGFHVTGVDHKFQPRYAGDVFVQADALEYVAEHGHEYDVIHASPPCQAYTPLRALYPERIYPDLIAQTREALKEACRPYVIENVPGAPFHNYIYLCGGMFGLRTYRHRRFEASVLIMQPTHPRHSVKTSTKKRRACWDAGLNISITGDVGTYCGPAAMGIDWMTGSELSQAIPPAFTEWIGKRIIGAMQ